MPRVILFWNIQLKNLDGLCAHLDGSEICITVSGHLKIKRSWQCLWVLQRNSYCLKNKCKWLRPTFWLSILNLEEKEWLKSWYRKWWEDLVFTECNVNFTRLVIRCLHRFVLPITWIDFSIAKNWLKSNIVINLISRWNNLNNNIVFRKKTRSKLLEISEKCRKKIYRVY